MQLCAQRGNLCAMVPCVDITSTHTCWSLSISCRPCTSTSCTSSSLVSTSVCHGGEAPLGGDPPPGVPLALPLRCTTASCGVVVTSVAWSTTARSHHVLVPLSAVERSMRGRAAQRLERHQHDRTRRMADDIPTDARVCGRDRAQHLERLGRLDPGQRTLEHGPAAGAHDQHVDAALCGKLAQHLSWLPFEAHAVHHVEALQHFLCKRGVRGGQGGVVRLAFSPRRDSFQCL